MESFEEWQKKKKKQEQVSADPLGSFDSWKKAREQGVDTSGLARERAEMGIETERIQPSLTLDRELEMQDQGITPSPVDITNEKKKHSLWDVTKSTIAKAGQAFSGTMSGAGGAIEITGKRQRIGELPETKIDKAKSTYQDLMFPAASIIKKEFTSLWNKTEVGKFLNDKSGEIVEGVGRNMKEGYETNAKFYEKRILPEYADMRDEAGNIDVNKLKNPINWLHQASGATGSMLPFIATSALTGGEAALGGAVMGLAEKGDAFQTYAQELAQRKGISIDNLSDEDIKTIDDYSTAYGIVSGFLESYAPSEVLTKMAIKKPGSSLIKRIIWETPLESIKTGIKEGGTEWTQRFSQNVLAKVSGINSGQNVTEGALDEAIAGFAGGALFGAAGGISPAVEKSPFEREMRGEPKPPIVPPPPGGAAGQPSNAIIKEEYQGAYDIAQAFASNDKKAIEEALKGAKPEDLQKADEIMAEVENNVPGVKEDRAVLATAMKEKTDIQQGEPLTDVTSKLPGGQGEKSKAIERIYQESIANEDFMFGKTTKDIEKTILKDGQLNPKLVKGRMNDVVQKLQREGIDATDYIDAMEGKTFKDYFSFDKANREAFARMIPDGSLNQGRMIEKPTKAKELAKGILTEDVTGEASQAQVKEKTVNGNIVPREDKEPPEVKTEQLEVPSNDKFYFREDNAGKDPEFVEVEAEKLEIPGLEKYDFFITKDERATSAKRKWRIYEGKTGRVIVGESIGSKAKAIEQATEQLNKHKDQLDDVIAKSANQAVSPRYKKSAIIPKEVNKTNEYLGPKSEQERVPGDSQMVRTESGGSGERAPGSSGEARGQGLGDYDSDARIRPTQRRDVIEEKRVLTDKEIKQMIADLKLDKKSEELENLSEESKLQLLEYEGIGGTGEEGRGALDEFYTPVEVVKKVWSLVLGNINVSGKTLNVLEPSAGTGRFIYNAPSNVRFTAYEIDPVSYTINKAVNPEHTIIQAPFESVFMDEKGQKKEVAAKYDLVIGNPPYYVRAGKYKGLGEESRIGRMEDYFIKRSLDVTKEGGLVAMVVPSSFIGSPNSRRYAMRAIAQLGYLKEAYRLPEKTFKRTSVGTDIIIIQKESTKSMEDVSERIDNFVSYFENNPQNVLGEEKTRTNRFGKEEKYIAGKSEEALGRITDINVTEAEVEPDVESEIEIVEETPISKPQRKRNEVKARQSKSKKERRAKKEFENSKAPQRMKKSPHIIVSVKKDDTAIQAQNVSISDEEKYLYENTLEDGSIRPEVPLEIKIENGNYYEGKYYTNFNYFSGDIYKKLEQLEKDKATISKAQYERQKTGLEAVKPKRLGINDIIINPLDEMVQRDIRYANERGVESSMIDHFIRWIEDLPYNAFEGSSRWNISNYVNEIPVRGGNKEENAKNRQKRREIGNKLFIKFYREELPDNIRKEVEEKYNTAYNSYVRPDYTNYPLELKVSKTFYKGNLELRPIQKEGASFLVNKGVGLIAYDVGVGKTLTAISAISEVMRRGWAKRPLIVVPKSIKSKWIEDISEALPGAKINMLDNLGGAFKYKGEIYKLKIKEGTITLMTAEGFTRLGYKPETYQEILRNINDVIYTPGKKSARVKALDIEKSQEIVAKMMKGTAGVFVEDLGFDHITVDEAHRYKNVFSAAKVQKEGKANEYGSLRGNSVERGLKMYLATQYILKSNGNRNVFLLTATPFTNSPIEIYSMMSLMAKGRLEELGITNINAFINKFVELESKLAVKADGSLRMVDQVRKFYNLQQLQKLITEYIDYRSGEEAGVKRPTKITLEKKLKMTGEQEELIIKAQELFRDKDAGTLKAIDELQKIGLSPTLSQYYTGSINYEDTVENSPKLKYTVESIKKVRSQNKNAAQIIYAEKGISIFPPMREYLIQKMGFKDDEVAILDSGASTQKDRIQALFQAGKIKVLFASPTVKEGVDLQQYSTDLYFLRLPWNPTDMLQVEGRTWRQGSYWDKVRIHYPLVENSNDAFIFQKLSEKAARIKNIFSYKGKEIDVSDIDFEESKYDLITDPIMKVEAKENAERAALENRIRILESEESFIGNRISKIDDLRDGLKNAEKALEGVIADKRDNLVEYYNDRVKSISEDITEEETRITSKGINISEAKKELTDKRKEITDLRQQQADLTTKYSALKEKAKNQKEKMSRERSREGDINDYEELTKTINEHGKEFFTSSETGKVILKPEMMASLSMSDKEIGEKLQSGEILRRIKEIKKEVNPNIRKLLYFRIANELPGGDRGLTDGALIYLSKSANTAASIDGVIRHEIKHRAKQFLSNEERQQMMDHYGNLSEEEAIAIFDKAKTGKTGKEIYDIYKGKYGENKEAMANELSNWDTDYPSKLRRILDEIIRLIHKITGLMAKQFGGAEIRRLHREVFNPNSKEFIVSDEFIKQMEMEPVKAKYFAINDGMTEKQRAIAEAFNRLYGEKIQNEKNDLEKIVENAVKESGIIGPEEAKNRIERMKKDIGIILELFGQSRDIFLKDEKQYGAAKIFEDVGTKRAQDKYKLDKEYAEILKPYFDLKKEQLDKVNGVLFAGDTERTVYNKDQLIQRGLQSKEEITAYYRVRKAFNKALASLNERMIEAGVSQDQIDEFNRSKAGYIPHQWKYKNAIKEQHLSPEGEWRTVSMESFKTKSLMEKELEQKLETDTIRFVPDVLESLDTDFFTEQRFSFENTKSIISKANVPSEMKEEMIEALRDMMKEKGFGRHFIRRAGVAGYEDIEQLPKTIADYFSGFNGFVTKMEAAPKYFEALQEIDARKQKKFYGWMRDSIAYEMGNSPEFSAAKQLAFAYYLANDVSFLAVNATQNFIIGMSELGKIPGAKFKAEPVMMKAMFDWATQNISAEEKSAVEYYTERGELGSEMTTELMGFKSNPLYRTVSKTLSKVLHTSTGFVEQHVNRIPAFLAARRLYVASGLSPEEASAKAYEKSEDIHFRYGKVHRPTYIRGRKGILFTFTHYIRSLLFLMGRDLKHREFMALGRKLFYTFLFGGISALPFASLVVWTYKHLIKKWEDDDDKKEAEKELSFWELALKRGLPAAMGVDLSNRVSIDIFGIESLLDDPKNAVKWTGAIGGLGQRFLKGGELAIQGRYFEAIAKLMPDAIGNVAKAYQGRTIGIRTSSGKPLMYKGEPLRYTGKEAVVKGMGFDVTRESEAYTDLGDEILRDEKIREFKKDRIKELVGQKKDLYEITDILAGELKIEYTESQRMAALKRSVNQEITRQATGTRTDMLLKAYDNDEKIKILKAYKKEMGDKEFEEYAAKLFAGQVISQEVYAQIYQE